MKTALITGGTGCIGAVAVRDLLDRGFDRVVIATRRSDPTRLKLWIDDPADQRIAFAKIDLGDQQAVRHLVDDHRPTHVVHLGALQSPDCDRDPELGMRINVGGVQALIEACERLDTPLRRFVFASSAAVYGPRAMYEAPRVCEDAPLTPPNRYGVWKVAGEQLCRLFHQRTDVPTICLRLNTTYGPGRDLGMTSAPTSAMKRVALGAISGQTAPYRMPYRGRENYHYVEDVGAHFAIAADEDFHGFAACNIRGETVEVADFLALIRQAATELGLADFVDLDVADDATENLFVSDLADEAIVAHFPAAPRTALAVGIERSLRRFQQLAKDGVLEQPR